MLEDMKKAGLIPAPTPPTIQIQGLEFMNGLSFSQSKNEVISHKIMSFFNHKQGYYKEMCLSNSFITHVINCYENVGQYFFQTEAQKQVNFDFGKCFEDACYDKLTYYDTLNENHYTQIAEMVKVFKPYLPKKYITDIEIFGVYNFEDFEIKIKGKIDVYTNKNIIDIKTTKCTTLSSFYKNCEAFGYFTQGFIYSKLVNDKSFKLLACSKTKLKKDGYRVLEVCFDETHFNKGKERLDKGLAILKKLDLLQNFIC